MKFLHHTGYIMVHSPNHHRASSNGYVYEHILIAEQMLGRILKDEEVVHHEDRDRTNNNIDNLFVFATASDHARYHYNNIMIKVDDYYISPSNVRTKKCEVCDNIFEYYPNASKVRKFCSAKCNTISQTKTNKPSKDELFNLVKIKSFVEIGRMFNVSDNTIRKWCKSYDLPYRKKDLKI